MDLLSCKVLLAARDAARSSNRCHSPATVSRHILICKAFKHGIGHEFWLVYAITFVKEPGDIVRGTKSVVEILA